jgi:hypothetical protein
MGIRVDDEDRLGPAMLRLSKRRRAFVVAALEMPCATQAQVARAAGFGTPTSSDNVMKVRGCQLMHSEKIIAALHEEASKRLRSSTVLGAAVLVEIAKDPSHKDRLRAAEMLLNRTGFHELHERKLTVEHRDLTGAELTARITELAHRLGVDPSRLLGQNLAPMKLIEAKAMETADVRPAA